MSKQVLMIGPVHTLREAARMMAARKVGAAVVVNPDDSGVGILTERDILNSVAAGENPDAELAGQHCTQDLVFAAPDWTLEEAAAAMVRGGFRHLVVVQGQDVVGLLSMRDIVRVWSAAASRPRPLRAARWSATDSAKLLPTLRYRSVAFQHACSRLSQNFDTWGA